MSNVSRPLIALLVGTVAFFALWIVALKPGSSSSGGGTPTHGLSAYQSAISKARHAVQTSTAVNARDGGAGSPPTASATPSPVVHPPVTGATNATTTDRSAGAPHGASKVTRGSAAAGRLGVVRRALHAHKALALLFYNPAGADDQAVRQELAAVPTHRGKVVKLTIPLAELPSYTAVTDQVPVNFSPTLVVIAPNGQAGEIVGFSDQFEIAQRVADALAGK